MSQDNDVETSVERVDPLVGTIFDKRFHIDERIATGGFGAIYRATHVKSGHVIALKVLLPSLAQDLGVVARFRREGDTLTALRNPHTISAYELGQAGDRTLFITMELLHGESLFERYKANGPFEWRRMVKIARQVCESLEEAHERGIVHRDLKPTNIHLEDKEGDIDYVKVLDFGIAKILRGGDFQARDITNAGQMIGTIDYMSPEQMVGAKVTGQTDIYTVGIVMYEMIAGCTPFGEAMTAAQALAAVMKTKPEPLYLRAPVPEELDRIVMRCLERDLMKRYQNVTELRLDLARLLAGLSPDRVHVIETKPIPRPELDESTQFTPPPKQLIEQSRRARRPSDEHTAFTPPPEKLLQEMRSSAPRKHSPVSEWDDDDESAATTAGRDVRAPRSTEEHERVTKVAKLSDIAAAASRSADDVEQPTARADESERVTKVARLQDIVGAIRSSASEDEQATVARLGAQRSDHEYMTSVARSPSRADNEHVTSVARLSEAAARMPHSDASERAATMPRDASERAMTMPRDGRGARDGDGGERTTKMPRDHRLDDDSGLLMEPETPPRSRWPNASDPDDTEQEAHTPTTARRRETAPPPATRAGSRTAPPPLPGMTAMPRAPQNPPPPRTLTPQNAPPSRSPSAPPPLRANPPQPAARPNPQGSAPLEPPPRPLPRQPDTPVPQLIAAPFSPNQRLPTPVPAAPPPLAQMPPRPSAVMAGQPIPPPLAQMPRPSTPMPGQPQMPSHVATPPGMLPYAATVPAMGTYTPQSPSGYPSPVPGYPPAQQPSGYPPPQQPSPVPGYPPQTALGMTPYSPQPPQQPMQPYLPYPQAPQRNDLAPPRATRSFDMGRQAAREATIRRLVWIAVLILAGSLGIILATQL